MQHDLMLEDKRLGDINPLQCGVEQCMPGYTFGPGTREYYLLHYVQSGKGTLENARGVHPVRAGQAFVIRPGEVTVYRADAVQPWQYTWIGFATTLPVKALLAPDVLEAEGLGMLFQNMLACEGTPATEWQLCGKIYELLALLAAKQGGGPAGGARENRRRVNMALNYISTNYTRNITVAEMAANLSLDRSYFSRVFKTHTGKSPQQYLVDYRLAKAAALLAGGSIRPAEAAQQAGYEDIANFTRMFRRRYGVPPGRYAQKGRPNG